MMFRAGCGACASRSFAFNRILSIFFFSCHPCMYMYVDYKDYKQICGAISISRFFAAMFSWFSFVKFHGMFCPETYASARTPVCVCVNIYTHTYQPVHKYTRSYLCTRTRARAHTHTHTHKQTYATLRTHTYMYMFTYIYMHINIHTYVRCCAGGDESRLPIIIPLIVPYAWGKVQGHRSTTGMCRYKSFDPGRLTMFFVNVQ